MSADWGSWFYSSGTRSSLDESNRSDVQSGDDETTVEPDQGNGKLWGWWVRMACLGVRRLTVPVLSHIISQLRPGADLSRVTLPTFILEPRSMLERITKSVGVILGVCCLGGRLANLAYTLL